jgi:2-isopropylmalate synthase
MEWKRARIVAFGSTRRARRRPGEDPNLRGLLEAGTSAVCIFGKSWDLHVTEALGIPLEENLAMIRDSVEFLKAEGREVLYDAEHFFDAYKRNAEYALETLRAAEEGGADALVLCDTNGGSLPQEVGAIVEAVVREVHLPLGIHAHNDSDTAVANTLVAVEKGVDHVQGTVNGFGERCGNANLCSVIPNLELKMGYRCIGREGLQKLTALSLFVSEVANLRPYPHMPYVGRSAFAHKGGIHVSAVQKNPETYEHIPPELTGNYRRILVSELAGKSTILTKAREFGLHLEKDSPQTQKILEAVKEMERQGYQFEGAEASFELLMARTLGKVESFFELEGFRVIVEMGGGREIAAEATVKLRVDGKKMHTAAEGDGPVNALDHALRKALEEFYPVLKEVHLTDYKVRVLDERAGTAAKVRVLIQSTDESSIWGTVGVSENILEASWIALVDSVNYKLMKESVRGG